MMNPRLSRVLLARLSALGLAGHVVFLAGCSSDKSETASDSIGPAGGTVTSSDGTTVVVPAGALTAPVTITIKVDPSAPRPAGAVEVGDAHVLGPEGQTFLKPVTVTEPFDPKSLPADVSANAIVVQTAALGSNAYQRLPTVLVDSRHVSAQSMHFSTFVPTVSSADGGLIEAGAIASEAATDASVSSEGPDGSGAENVDAGASNVATDSPAHAADAAVTDATVMDAVVTDAAGSPADAAAAVDSAPIETTDAAGDAAPVGCSYTSSRTGTSVGGGGAISVNATCGSHKFALSCGTCPVDAGAGSCTCSFDGYRLKSGVSGPLCPDQGNAESALEQTCGFQLANDGGVVLPDLGQTPVLLAKSAGIASIAVNGTAIYWIVGGTQPAALMTVGLAGGTPTTLDSVDAIVGNDGTVVLDQTNVYWSYNLTTGGSINRMPLGGGPVTHIAGNLARQPTGVAVDGTHVYWAVWDGTINMAPIAGGTTMVLASNQPAYKLAVRNESVYYTTGDAVMKVGQNGAPPVSVATLQSQARDIAVDDTNVYWSNVAGNVMKAPIAGGTPIVIASASNAWAMVADSSGVYYANSGTTSSLQHVGSNGTVETLSLQFSSPMALALDATSIYIGDGGHLLKLTKAH